MQAQHAQILLVEPDPQAARALEHAFEREGLDCIRAQSGQQADIAMLAQRPLLVILNPHLDAEDGWRVYRDLRRHNVPIMLLMRLHDSVLARAALTLGARDCVIGDMASEEVVARARLLLRRADPQVEPAQTFAGLTLDPTTRAAFIDGRSVGLTRTEYAVLAALMRAEGRVVPRDRLAVLTCAHADGVPLARSVEAHVRSLRRKLGDDPQQPERLLSVRGFGYRLAAPTAVSPTQLAVGAFEALVTPTFVIDRQQRVLLMNRAAEQSVGRPREQVIGRLSCSAVLRCRASRPAGAGCPALDVLRGALVVATSGGCTASRLSEQHGHLLLQLKD